MEEEKLPKTSIEEENTKEEESSNSLEKDKTSFEKDSLGTEEKDSSFSETEQNQQVTEDKAKEELLQKIGSPQPFQLSISLGGEELDTLTFDQDSVSIGRSVDCDVVIDNLGASRFHARIERYGRFFLLVDLGSKTGTYIRGKRIDDYCLNSGDEIFLAKHTLTFQKLTPSRWNTPLGTKTTKAPKQREKRQQLMETMAVDFRSRAQKQITAPAYLNLIPTNRRFPVEKTLIFSGKSSQCDFTINGLFISDRHAILFQQEKNFYLYHLGLFKPPYVNNKPIESALLQHGDIVKIGDIHFTFLINPEFFSDSSNANEKKNS